jgi:hypothetical protein
MIEALNHALDPTLLAEFGLARGSNEEAAAALRQWLGERLGDEDLRNLNRLPDLGEQWVSAQELRKVGASLEPAQDVEIALTGGALSISELTSVQRARLLVHRPQLWDDAFTAVMATVAARELGLDITMVDPELHNPSPSLARFR